MPFPYGSGSNSYILEQMFYFCIRKFMRVMGTLDGSMAAAHFAASRKTGRMKQYLCDFGKLRMCDMRGVREGSTKEAL
jgi:hypothetical protein